MPQHITTVTDPLAHRLKDVLRSKAARPRTIIIDDHENIAQAVAAKVRIETLFITSVAAAATARLTAEKPALLELFADAQLPEVVTIEPAAVKALFGDDKHVKIFALATAPTPRKLSSLLTDGSVSGDIVVLDGVKIVGNIGAITRTACALGAAGVVLLESDLKTVYDRRLVRASRGLVFTLPVIIASQAQFADFVAAQRIPVATLDIAATAPLTTIKQVKEPLALVLGSEREGVSKELTELATHRYVIKMDPRVESLNVSVTAAIALFQHQQD